MKQLLNKTTLGSLAGALLTIAWGLGWIDEQTATVLAGLIASATGVALRLAVGKHGYR